MTRQSKERWDALQRLFDDAVALSPAERAAYLDRECGDDAELRREIESLIDHDSDAHTLGGVVDRAAAEVVQEHDEHHLGEEIGSYRVVERIAEGGMGTVYLGERVDGEFEQKVAVKLLSTGLPSTDARRRFVGERQILASLNHPCIAQLIDGGTTDSDEPYLVMEYIEGEAIDDYCDRHDLSVQDRLELFKQVCSVVEHAHQNLVIHRDLKPSNILVTPDGIPKLLDFGIAKLLAPDELDVDITLSSQFVRPMTPAHASPEQVRGEAITVATDVYALGVLLYELLCGQAPFKVSSSTLPEIERIICETTPQAPSAAVGRPARDPSGDSGRGDSSGDSAPAGDLDELLAEKVAGHRATSTRRLRRRLRGDLDAIVQMAMQKEPQHRYSSVGQLAEDIERHLSHVPVRARSQSAGYRVGRFIARHAAAVAATAVIVLVSVTLVGYYTAQLADERDRARLEARKAAEVSEFLSSVFRLADPSEAGGENLSARELLDRGARRLDEELASQPEVLAEMLVVIGNNYHHLGLYDEARDLIERSVDVRRELHGSNHPDVGDALYALGLIRGQLGEYEAALRVHQEALELRRADDPLSSDVGDSMREVGRAFANLSRLPEAEQTYAETLALLRRIESGSTVAMAETLETYGAYKRAHGDLDGGRELLVESLEMKRELHGERHMSVAHVLNSLALLEQESGDLEAARDLFEESLELRRALHGDDHIGVGKVLGNLGNLQYALGRFADSERYTREAMPIFERAYGPDHPNPVFLLENLANAQLALGQTEEAVSSYRECLAKMRQIFGEGHFEVGLSLANLGGGLLIAEEFLEAETLFASALEVFRKTQGEEGSRIPDNLNKLGQARQGQGDLDGAERLYREAFEMSQRVFPGGHGSLFRAKRRLGQVHLEQGRNKEAERDFREALELMARLLPANSPRLLSARSDLGMSFLRQGPLRRGGAKDRRVLRVRDGDAFGLSHRRRAGPQSDSGAL